MPNAVIAYTRLHFMPTSSQRSTQFSRNVLVAHCGIRSITSSTARPRPDVRRRPLSLERAARYRRRNFGQAFSHVAERNRCRSHRLPVDFRVSAHSLGPAQDWGCSVCLHQSLGFPCSLLLWSGLLGSVGLALASYFNCTTSEFLISVLSIVN